MQKANASKLGYVGSKPGAADPSRDSDSWFTPREYVDAARKVFGGRIALDPFSSAEANKTVKARRFYTEADDAFTRKWTAASVWMNPPYSAKLAREAVARLCEEIAAGSVKEAVVLVNNATETQFFQRMLREAQAVCFTDHRIKFWNADGKAVSGNTRGQAFFYFGPNPEKFRAVFSAFGHVTYIV